MEYASNGKGNLGVTLGAIGTGLGILNGGVGLIGMNQAPAQDRFVSRDEMRMIQDLAAKDSEIALLKSEQDSEIKMTEVYKQNHAELAAVRDAVNADLKEIRNDIANFKKDQSVANVQMSDSIAVLGDKVANVSALLGQITQTKVPNSAVCPGWGPVNVYPAWPNFAGSGTTIA